MKNPTDSVSDLITRFLDENDFTSNTRRAFSHDILSVGAHNRPVIGA